MKKGLALAAISALILAAAIHLLIPDRPGGEGGASPGTLPRGISGAVVYECGEGICKTVLETGEEVLLVPRGTYPRWSPDGRYVAFLRDGGVMRIRADGGGEELLARTGSPRAVNYHPGGDEIIFTDGREVKSVSLESGEVRSLLQGREFMEIDVSPAGDRLIATVRERGFRIVAFRLPQGTTRSLVDGCSASLSPDGDLFTSLDRSHTRLSIRSFSEGTVQTVLPAPRGLKFDNQFWSNHPDWLASRSEGREENIFVHQVSTGASVKITSSGAADRPDLYLERVP